MFKFFICHMHNNYSEEVVGNDVLVLKQYVQQKITSKMRNEKREEKDINSAKDKI